MNVVENFTDKNQISQKIRQYNKSQKHNNKVLMTKYNRMKGETTIKEESK